jgi:Lon protease-like protein
MPLFPLRTVLFPGMPLPLRIFEERYKVMIQELLASGGDFGVILIREGEEVGGGAKPYSFGTIARIIECQEIQGGRFVLEARGTRRFKLTRMLSPRPYPYGEIEILDDYDETPTPQLKHAVETVRTTFPLYFRLALTLTDQWAQSMKLPNRAHELVNFIGPWLQAEEDAKQRLLEFESAADRVAHLAEMLDELLSHAREEVDEHHRLKYKSLGSAN